MSLFYTINKIAYCIENKKLRIYNFKNEKKEIT